MRKYVFTSGMARAADASAVSYGVSVEQLMYAAASALFRTIAGYTHSYTVIFCGSGNNGGDGYALCRLLLDEGRYAVCIALTDEPFSPLCGKMRSLLPPETVIDSFSAPEAAFDAVKKADTVVDCVFGTGFHGKLPENVVRFFSAAAGKTVIACDIPSGVPCDNGIPAVGTLRAEKTVTFAFYKPCFFLSASRELCGEVVLADIGMPEAAIASQKPKWELTDIDFVRKLIKPRSQLSHKGTFGSVQLFCGSELMTGAAALAAEGALRSGAGLVYITLPEKARQVLQSGLYEPVYTLPDAVCPVNAQVVGPGLGDRRKDSLRYLLRGIPTVADADALNAVAEQRDCLLALPLDKLLLTPHPAEFARLTDSTVAETERDRFTKASAFASKYGCVLLLKGHFTLIALPDGHIYVNTTGNSGLAKGGSGDVLAGFAGGLLAQGYGLAEAAVISAFLHGRAAEYLVKHGMSEGEILPSDILTCIGKKEKLLDEME